MRLLKNIFLTIITTALVIIFPFVVATFVTSRTSVLLDIRSYNVLTGSMTPLFPVGSMVYVQKEPMYNEGEIITFVGDSNRNITHRIVGKTEKDNKVLYVTKGDANNVADKDPVPEDKVIGKVFFFVPYMGSITHYLRNPINFVGFIIVPVIIFIGIELWAIKNEIVRMTEKRVMERLQRQQ